MGLRWNGSVLGKRRASTVRSVSGVFSSSAQNIFRADDAWPRPLNKPTDIADCTLWIDFSDSSTLFTSNTGSTTVAADGAIARADSKTGVGGVYQSTGNNRPLRKTSVQNGLDVARFDGTNDTLIGFGEFLQYSKLDAWTVVIVAKPVDATNDTGQTIYSNPNLWSYRQYAGLSTLNTDNMAVFNYDGNWDSAQVAFTYNSAFGVFCASADGSNIAISVDGGAEQTTASGSTDGGVMGTNSTAGGSLRLCNGFDDFQQGDVGEFVMYNRALSAGEKSDLITHLKTKWGI